VRVIIDSESCSGHGRCYSLAPGLFVDDEAGFGQVVGTGELGDEQIEAARTASRACPERAVHIEGDLPSA
jgi:ferredoxin